MVAGLEEYLIKEKIALQLYKYPEGSFSAIAAESNDPEKVQVNIVDIDYDPEVRELVWNRNIDFLFEVFEEDRPEETESVKPLNTEELENSTPYQTPDLF